MNIIRTVAELRSTVQALRDKGLTIGFVPTMGALHDGHMSLVKRSLDDCDATVVSVFVNPTQFNNPNDLTTYPRTEEADCRLLEQAGVDIAFVPSVQEVYPEPDTRVFDLGPVAEVMEGAMRPGHFNGVAQVVSRLFDMVQPDRAYFGEKDFQQIAVLRRMAQLIDSKVEIVDCPICRHDDGLAMSSRNMRLSAHQRNVAPAIYAALSQAPELAQTHSVEQVRQAVIDQINSRPELEVEYFEIADADTLQPITDWQQARRAIGCITVHCGDVRLIDNIMIKK